MERRSRTSAFEHHQTVRKPCRGERLRPGDEGRTESARHDPRVPAERADIDGTYPSLLERGLRNPGLSIVIAIGEALGVGGDVLVRRTITLLRQEQQPR